MDPTLNKHSSERSPREVTNQEPERKSSPQILKPWAGETDGAASLLLLSSLLSSSPLLLSSSPFDKNKQTLIATDGSNPPPPASSFHPLPLQLTSRQIWPPPHVDGSGNLLRPTSFVISSLISATSSLHQHYTDSASSTMFSTLITTIRLPPLSLRRSPSQF
jgi:hypothetical protein